MVGASEYILLSRVSYVQAFPNVPIGDMCLVSREKLIATPLGSLFLPRKFTKVLHYRSIPGRLSVHESSSLTGSSSSSNIGKSGELGEELSSYLLHSRAITCMALSANGNILATGSEDVSVRLWSYKGSGSKRVVESISILAGHRDSITCIDINTEFSLMVTGSFDQQVCCWDMINSKLIRILGPFHEAVESVSIRATTGDIAVLTNTELYLFTINGTLLAQANNPLVFRDKGTVALAPPCALWQDGTSYC